MYMASEAGGRDRKPPASFLGGSPSRAARPREAPQCVCFANKFIQNFKGGGAVGCVFVSQIQWFSGY